MQRRRFLQSGAGALLSQQKKVEELAVAAASQDKTPRVGIVLSNFHGSEDHDGTKLQGLPDPQPVDAALTAAQLDAMLRKAIELGNTRRGGLAAIVKPEDWVVVLPDVSTCPASNPACSTDPRLVRSLVAWLVEHHCGARITIAGASASYRDMAADFGQQHRSVQFDVVDLNADEPLELPVPGKPSATRNPDSVYFIPQTIQQCDRVISVAPLKTHPRTRVSLSIGNYFGIAPVAKYGPGGEKLFELGAPHEVLIDLFSFHTADYAILGGETGRNLVIAGPSAPAVDAAGAAVLGLAPAEIEHLKLAEKKGYGLIDLDLIWTRGNKIEEASPRSPGG